MHNESEYASEQISYGSRLDSSLRENDRGPFLILFINNFSCIESKPTAKKKLGAGVFS